MINPFKEVNWHPDYAAKRTFAKSFIIGFPCIALTLFLINRFWSGTWNPNFPLWLGGIGLLLGIILWILPSIVKPFYIIWFALACSVGLVVSNTFLVGFYFIFFTLVGGIRRVFGKKSLQKGFAKNASSYWNDAEVVTDVKQYYRQS